MKTKRLKPIDGQDWRVALNDTAHEKNLSGVARPENYVWYLMDGIWEPHRKPTVHELGLNMYW